MKPSLRPRRASLGITATATAWLGSTFTSRITDREHAPLRIGSQSWTSHEIATQLGCVHVAAARLLTRAAESIDAKNVRDLYLRSTPYTFAGVERLGPTTMWVLWRLFETQGLDPEAWTATGERGALVTFGTMKKRELAAAAREKADHKQRSHRSRLPTAADYNA